MMRFVSMAIVSMAVAGVGSSEAPAANAEMTAGDQAIRDLLGGDSVTIRLWPGDAPDEPGTIGAEVVNKPDQKRKFHMITNVTQPTITLVRPVTRAEPAAAVLVCPGGGYGGLAAEHEGAEIVRWLNLRGAAGALLKYRVPRRDKDFPKHYQALQDAQRAMGLLRQGAREWNIDPERIGILGFSAGGHLCAALSNNHEERTYKLVDEADRLSCRPAFAVLIYPAYLTEPADSSTLDPLLHPGELSRERTAPTFISVAENDAKFMRGGVEYFLALAGAKVPAELHVYEGGGHGTAMRAYPLSEWTAACARWMKDHGAGQMNH